MRVYDTIRELSIPENAVKNPKEFTIGHLLSSAIVSIYLTSVLVPIGLFIVGIIAAIKLI